MGRRMGEPEPSTEPSAAAQLNALFDRLEREGPSIGAVLAAARQRQPAINTILAEAWQRHPALRALLATATPPATDEKPHDTDATEREEP